MQTKPPLLLAIKNHTFIKCNEYHKGSLVSDSNSLDQQESSCQGEDIQLNWNTSKDLHEIINSPTPFHIYTYCIYKYESKEDGQGRGINVVLT